MSFIRHSEDVDRIAEVKRLFEYVSFIPGFREKYAADPAGTLSQLGLTHITLNDLAMNQTKDGAFVPQYANGALSRYHEFVRAKLEWREQIKRESASTEPTFEKWRSRQINRCAAAFSSARSVALIHAVAAFELSDGCSVGCPFCGLSAGRLKKVFRYTEENAKLWNDVLAAMQRVLGDCVRHAPCYYGTEPTDNPDYELFIEDFRNRFGIYPQLTTAVACRDLDRTAAIVGTADPLKDSNIHRFSIRCEEDFHRIVERFTPRELLLFELLAQYEAAPACAIIRVGKNASGDDISYGETISCVSGFLVNMATRTIRLITPVGASKRFPNGQKCIGEATFTDAVDFEDKLKQLIAGIKLALSPKETAALYPWLNGREDGGRYLLENDFDHCLDLTGIHSLPVVKRLVALLRERSYTRRQIVDKLQSEFPDMDRMALMYAINTFFNLGFIWDSEIFGAPDADAIADYHAPDKTPIPPADPDGRALLMCAPDNIAKTPKEV